MIYILNIGYTSYAFSSSRGLQTVMDALAKASPLKHHYYQGCEKEDPDRLDLDDGPVEVSMHVVNGVSFVSGKTKRNVIEPEVLPRQRGSACKSQRGIDALKSVRLLSTPPSSESFFHRMIGEGK